MEEEKEKMIVIIRLEIIQNVTKLSPSLCIKFLKISNTKNIPQM